MKELKFNIMKVRYHNETILNDISGDITTGQIMAVKGRSGIGKTTLLNALKGIVKMYGIITILEENHVRRPHMNDADLYYAPCDKCLLDAITVNDNMLIIKEMYQSDVNIDTVFDELKISDCLSKKPCELSSGQYKRVLIAGGIISKASFLLLDEPTSNLDKESCDIIIHVLCSLISHNVGIITATHDDEIINMADILLEL